MKSLPIWFALLLGSVTLALILVYPTPAPAGDIADYFGATETVLRHGSFDLNADDQERLSTILHPAYFTNPGYYIQGTDGKRYPFHFIAYSLFLIPFRIILDLFHIPSLKVFGIANTIGFIVLLIFLLQKISSTPRKWLLILLTITSPLLFFTNWPGPDLLVLGLTMVGLWYWLSEAPFTAGIWFAIASWQSQPVALLAVVAIGYGFLNHVYMHQKLSFRNKILYSLGILALLTMPYLYNLHFFGTISPWINEQDGWTKLYGFGLHNLSFRKLYEQAFDLNIGVFWYAPILCILGSVTLLQKMRSAIGAWITVSLLLVLFAFQTNPAWHYGTAGFGPSRHAVIFFPFFIMLVTVWSSIKKRIMILFVLVFLTQVYLLSINNYIFPLFTNTLFHSPLAKVVLDRFPSLYNPTPEIFTDRTNHDDPDHPVSAIYTYKGKCKKAYVLFPDIDHVLKTCGPFPVTVQGSVSRVETDGFYVNYP